MRAEQPVIFWTLILAVTLAPLPFASVYAWSWSLLACVVGGLVAAWSVRVIVGAQKAAFGLRATWPFLLPFVALTIWLALQTVSWTPAPWHHPLWDSAARALDLPLPGRISLNPDETLSALTRLLAYGGIFWLALQYARRTLRAEQIFYAIIAAGVGYGILGVAQTWLGWHSRLGLPGAGDGWATGGGAAPDHPFATYVSLALVCVSSFILSAGAPTPRKLSFGDLARRLIDGGVASRRLLGAWLLLLAIVPAFGSREDGLSLWLALAVLAAVALAGKLARWPRVVVFAVTSVLVVSLVGLVKEHLGVAPAGDGPGVEQLDRLRSLTRDAVGDAPMLGTGAGTFEEVFRFYRTGDFKATVTHAGSGYHEALLELGTFAAGALFLLFAGFGLLTLTGALRRQRDSAYAAAGLAATVLVASHAAFDYSLKVPAIAATYCLLVGAACAQSWSSRREDDAW
ncbi:MAG: hypothetical protein U0S49_03365 [Rhodospirillales bacterium]|nr:hypothetical protein [Rhodospirillales bacterium]